MRCKPVMYKGRRFKSVTALREYHWGARPLYYFRRAYARDPTGCSEGRRRHAASRVEVVTPDGMSYPSIAAYAELGHPWGARTACARALTARTAPAGM